MGSYSIKVKAKDESGKESSWSDPLPVSMQKSRTREYQLIRLVLERFPILLKLFSL